MRPLLVLSSVLAVPLVLSSQVLRKLATKSADAPAGGAQHGAVRPRIRRLRSALAFGLTGRRGSRRRRGATLATRRRAQGPERFPIEAVSPFTLALRLSAPLRPGARRCARPGARTLRRVPRASGGRRRQIEACGSAVQGRGGPEAGETDLSRSNARSRPGIPAAERTTRRHPDPRVSSTRYGVQPRLQSGPSPCRPVRYLDALAYGHFPSSSVRSEPHATSAASSSRPCAANSVAHSSIRRQLRLS